MSTIRERQADQSYMLLGRTRAERLLDGIYQRQKRYLLQRRRRAAAEAARCIVLPEEKRRRLLDVIPEPVVSRTAAAAGAEVPADQRQRVKQHTREGTTGASAKEKNVEDAVEALQRHLWRHSKFDKAVQLLQQLWKSHLNPETKRCLLSGLLTAASTDNCISSPSGRAEVASLFRTVVEPVLQRECERRRQAELIEQEERLERTKLRAALLNARLQCAVMSECRPGGATQDTVAASSQRRDAAREATRTQLNHSKAGTRATIAAVAAAAAAAVDREQHKQQQQLARSATARPSISKEGRSGITRGAVVGALPGVNVTAGSGESGDKKTNAVTCSRGLSRPQQSPSNAHSGEDACAEGKSEEESEDIQLDDAEKELLEVLQLRCKTHLLLFTDDAFQFNQQVAELRRIFDAMQQDMQAEEDSGVLSDDETFPYGSNLDSQEVGSCITTASDSRSATCGEHSAEKSLSTAAAERPAVHAATAAIEKGRRASSIAPRSSLPEVEYQHQQPKLQRPHDKEAITSVVCSETGNTGHGDSTDKTHVTDVSQSESTAMEPAPAGPASAEHSKTARDTEAGHPLARDLKTGSVAVNAQEAEQAHAHVDAGSSARKSPAAVHDETGNSTQTFATKLAEVNDETGSSIQGPTAGIIMSKENGADVTAQGLVNDTEEDEDIPVAPEERWPLPLKKRELRNLLQCFFMDCLASVFSYRNMAWARAAIEQLFQHVYLHRFIFSESDRGQIGLWQAQLKTPLKASANVSALRIGEAPVPVQDGRDERISTIHGSIVWSAKQMGA